MKIKGQATLAYMTALSEMFGGYGIQRRRPPHYFEYSGIPTDEQLLKRAERKARKQAKKAKKKKQGN